MLRERVAPQSEVIRAIVLEDSPCCGGPAPALPLLSMTYSPCFWLVSTNCTVAASASAPDEWKYSDPPAASYLQREGFLSAYSCSSYLQLR